MSRLSSMTSIFGTVPFPRSRLFSGFFGLDIWEIVWWRAPNRVCPLCDKAVKIVRPLPFNLLWRGHRPMLHASPARGRFEAQAAERHARAPALPYGRGSRGPITALIGQSPARRLAGRNSRRARAPLHDNRHAAEAGRGVSGAAKAAAALCPGEFVQHRAIRRLQPAPPAGAALCPLAASGA